MTDQELLALVQEKTPDELSLEEIELLRQRIAESRELREALFGQMQMEAYLATAFGRINISPQDILARAQGRGWQFSVPLVCLVLAVPLVLLLAAALWNALQAGRAATDKVAENLATKTPVGEEVGPKSKIQSPTADVPDRKSDVSGAKAAPKAPPASQDMKTAVPTTQTPAAPSPPQTPWQEALAIQGDLPKFTQVAFEDFETAKTLPRRTDLQKWFESVPGQNYRITEVDTPRGRCGVLEGSTRLRAPWTEDSALKFALENYNRLTIHLYRGEQGVMLVYYQDGPDRWAAYTTQRKPGKTRPETFAITATDDDRARRTELRFGGPMELRWRKGEVILSRGDVVLVSAPLAGLPDDVYFEGRAAFLGLSLVRQQDDPPPLASRPVTFETNRPAELEWKSSKPQIAQPEKLADGSLRLAADKAKERVECFTPIPVTGLQEVVLELDDITPGTSVYLGLENGAAPQVVRFQRNTKNGQLGVRLAAADDAAESDLGLPSERVAPSVLPHCFVRMVYGCGNFRWWVSSDSKHWAQVEMALDSAPPGRGYIGLQVVANRPEGHITLRRIELRELSGLSSLAVKEVRDKALAAPMSPSLGHWLGEITRRQPPNVDAGEWRRACAIRTLGAGTTRDLAYLLLELLLDDAAVRKLPLEAQLAALHDATLLAWDLRDGHAMRIAIPRRFLELGQRAFDEEGLPPWSSVRHAAMSVPVMSYLQQPATPEQNLRWELIQAAYAHEPDQTLTLCRKLRFFQQQQYAPLLEWAENSARRDVPVGGGGALASRLKDSWRHPLVEELSKDAYNTLNELQAVLESEAWEDAARMVTSFDPEAAPGVAPYHKDKELLVSLPVAVRLTLADYPQLKEAMGERFGALAKLRIGQAVAGGDAASLELATVQFGGTEAAAQAHHWLGDRALSSGWFERAIAEYRRAEQIQPSLAAELAPRVRLAAAMLGQDSGKPAERGVEFGEVKMTKEQFEALIAEMRSRGNAAMSSTVLASTRTALPPPSAFQVTLKAKLDGPIGDKPQEEVGRRTNQYRVPWSDRQIATVLEEDILYVSNRFQVASYNLVSGQRVWQSVAPPGPMQKAQDWAMIAMKPLVTQSHIYARQLYGASPTLVCLEKTTGKLIWSSAQQEKEFLVSDPVLVQGQLGALSITLTDQQEGVLRWSIFDPQTGEVQSQRELIRLRNTWGARACCEVVGLEDSIVAVLGGVTFSIDPVGNLRWVRKHVVLPADEEPRWLMQLYQRPIMEEERIYMVQPGVRAVDCLDVQSGARLWTAVIPDIVSIVGLSQDKLITRTEGDVRALDKTTGKLIWRATAPDMHSFALCGENTVLLAQREPVSGQNNQMQSRLTWLDSSTGVSLASTVPPNLIDPDPRLGPLVLYKDRVWTFFGRGQHDPVRDLVEFAPQGEPERATQALTSTEAIWQRHLPLNQSLAAQKQFPDWQLVSSAPGDRSGAIAEVHGEKDVLGLRATAGSPVCFIRQIMLPGSGKPRLRIRVGTDPGQIWKLSVMFGDNPLQTIDVSDATHPDRFKQFEIDLTPVAGQSGTLSIQAQFVSPGDATSLFWKSLEVLF